MTQTAPIAIDESAPQPPPRNPAVERCRAALERSLKESRAKNRDNYDTKKHAGEAYKAAMPDLSGYENIRDFIACVTHGMMIEVVSAVQGSGYLYAAQVATGVLRQEPKNEKRPSAA